ncbi:DUF805 domain-containing protein, partial [Pseudomonas aeruginosa]|uniref:DUF805 domain-containing protein n=1 Tax=Pseudomonas aeruginosa TaxID=287 RepID=UPI0031B71981
MDWYLKVLKNYVGFRGRARRKEYWMFILVNIIFTFVLGLLDKMLGWQRAGGEGVEELVDDRHVIHGVPSGAAGKAGAVTI